MEIPRFGLTDDEFWTDPGRTIMEVADALWDRGDDVLAIDAPTFVAVDQRETLPVSVVRAASCRALAELDFDTHALVTAMDLDRNRLYAAMVNDDEDRIEGEAGDDLDGYSADTAVPELRRQLRIPWQPGRLRVTAILRERASNRVDIELGTSPSTYRDEEVERFVAEQARTTPAPAVRPPPDDPLPSYDAGPQSLDVPTSPGLVLKAERVTVDRPGAVCRLDGAFRLVPHDHERVKQIIDSPITPGRPTTAVVGITLLIVPADGIGPKVLRLFVPSSTRIEGDTPEVCGVFALDLLAEQAMSTPQTYFVYAFSTEHMVGPIPAALVSEATLHEAPPA